MLIEVPAQVIYQETVQNYVVVKGGTNWDLSRSAVTTPIAPLVAGSGDSEVVAASTGYRPEHRMPSYAPDVTVTFSKNSAKLSAAALSALKQLPAKSQVVVAGHADSDEKKPTTLAKQRANVVAAYLKKKGYKVEANKAFSAELPLTNSNFKAEANRRVEVFTPLR